MKRNLYSLFKILIFIFCCSFIIYSIGIVTCFNYSFWNIKPFKAEPENSVDVVFVGSSEMSCDYIPTTAWEEYGFTSYIYGVDSEPISLFKYSIEEIKKTQNPQLYVIEIYGVSYDEGMQTDEISIRRYIDNIPTSYNKWNAIYHLQKDNIGDYFFNSIAKYHENYKQPFDVLFYLRNGHIPNKLEYSYSKGCQLHSGRISRESINNYIDTSNDDSTTDLADDAYFYLNDLLEYLKNNNIDNVLFIYNPHLSTNDNYSVFKRVNKAGEIIEKAGFSFINYSKSFDEIGLSIKDDFRDEYHLNVMGSEKFTRFLSKDIVSRISVNQATNEIVNTKWKESATIVNENIKKCKQNYLNNKEVFVEIADMS